MDADFITLHVPLTKTGEDKTWHVADAAFLNRMKPGAVLLNTCRGAVLDNAAASSKLKAQNSKLVLDVWEGEPNISPELVVEAALGTPHIAGYSYDGKVNGTTMVYQAACKAIGAAADWDARPMLPPSSHATLALDASGRDDEDVLREAALTVYDIEADDRRLRTIAGLPAGERGAYFDRLRKEYPQRREFQNSTLTLRGGSVTVRRKLAGIGFKLKD